jgi:hypothetical protein
MSLFYCNEKLSLAVFEMCVSTKSLRDRLRDTVKHGFTAFPEEIFPEELREQFSEIRTALAGVRVGSGIENYPDAIDRMKAPHVRRLLDQFISLREGVARECYRRASEKSQSNSKDNNLTEETIQKVKQLLGR